MSHHGKNKKVLLSIIDRLIDDNPENQSHVDIDSSHTIDQVRINLRRDLENLLNTRYRVVEPSEKFEELEISLLNYGLPDLATINTLDIANKNRFIKNLEKQLIHYEPRFKHVQVNFIQNQDKSDRVLRFNIEATVYADPYPEKITFDSVLEPVTRTVNIKEIH